MSNQVYRAVVIGVSMGGMEALTALLTELPADYPLPLLVVQHQSPQFDSNLPEILDRQCRITVVEGLAGMPVEPGCVYIAPPAYHLLVEPDETLGLSVDPPVNFSIPSVDVLFESAAEVYRDQLIGIVLTGANSDGARGLKAVKAQGGMALVQEPATAMAPQMPNAAMAATRVDRVLTLPQLAEFLTLL